MTDWYSDDKATFGDRLAAARDAAGLSTEDLARRLGVREKTVAAWEDDMAEPRANRLQMLAGLLNVSLMWLLTGRGEGIAEPGEGNGAVPADIESTLTDLRLMQAEMGRMADRIGLLEKRLRRVAREGAQR